MSVLEERSLREQFFHFVYGDRVGFACIASETTIKGNFKQRYFQWPIEESQLLSYVERLISQNLNVWYGVNLLKRKQRNKENVLPGNLLWADLDTCHPESVEPKPQLAVESSPGRFQAIWRLDQELDPKIAEDYSRRIAYNYFQEDGKKIDGCWNADRLLRVPYTYNVKEDYPERPKVKLVWVVTELLPTEVFDILSQKPVTESDARLEESIPTTTDDPAAIIVKHKAGLLQTHFAEVWDYEPTTDDDWSKLLWRLLLCCFEGGLSIEETYSVAYHSSVNKYRRDKRPTRYLWRDVNKAHEQAFGLQILTSAVGFDMPELIPGDNYKFKGPSFIRDYVEWGREATDAPAQYHELASIILLSTLLSGNLKLLTTGPTIKPNLWGLVLGESSVTRKTTAMNMARDIIDFIDRDILIATDGSSEGILTGISGRPGRPSMYYRDEVVGLINEIAHKQYLAGIPQMFTQLYDGGFIARRLRKEMVTVTDPVFIFFGGGIKDQFFTAANEDFIYSGFLPRFLIVSGETPISELRRLGPPTEQVIGKRQKIYEMSHKLYREYSITGDAEILGQPGLSLPVNVEVELTPDAWNLNGEISERFTRAAYDSPNKGLASPVFQRLADSMLKMAMLIAAARQIPDDGKIQASVDDIREASMYVQQWGNYSIEVMLNLGQTTNMKAMERVRKYIEKNPGVARSRVMQAMNLNKRQVQEIEETLEARGEIRVDVHAGGRSYKPIN